VFQLQIVNRPIYLVLGLGSAPDPLSSLHASGHKRRSSVNFRGKTFLPEKYVWKINKFPNFTWFLPEDYQDTRIFMIFARKLKKLNFPNFTWYLPENARILHDSCPKNIFFRGWVGTCLCSPSPTPVPLDPILGRPPPPSQTYLCALPISKTWLHRSPVISTLLV